MYPALRRDRDCLTEITAQTAAHAAAKLDAVGQRPVVTEVPSTAGQPLPDEGVGFTESLRQFAQRWEPGFSASAGPRYWGFVTGGTTPAALAGDWLASAHDQNMMWGREASSRELELETLSWLQDLLDLPANHTEAFVSGATMANMTGIAVGRQWIGRQHDVDISSQGMAALGPVTVLSANPHSGIGKAMSILGMGRENLTKIASLPAREAVDIAALATALEGLEGKPAIVVANAGTVNTGDFDDFRQIAQLRNRFGFWLHVDAAFGAFASLSDDHAHLVAGMESADSVCVDLHKWLNVPYDSAVLFTRHRREQAEVFANDAAYLDAAGPDSTFNHLVPENSRRLRALPAWFSLSAYGRNGYTEIVRRNLAAAQELATAIEAMPRYRLLAPVRLNIVCFTPHHAPQRAQAVADALAATGDAFVTTTTYRGIPALRAALVNWRTTSSDIAKAARALETVGYDA